MAIVDLGKDFVEDTEANLVVPKRMVSIVGSTAHPFQTHLFGTHSNGTVKYNQHGAHLTRDDDTGILHTPPYNSGVDVVIARSVVGGDVANVGYGGVIDPSLSSLIAKLSHMVATWKPMVTGKRLARRRTMEVIARANDSDFGPAEFMRQIAAGWMIDNPGVAFAQLPIYSIPFESWESYGIEAIPIANEETVILANGTSIAKNWYLNATQRSILRNRTLETVDVLHIKPTGIKEWPFWIWKPIEIVDGRTAGIWVLVPRLVGGLITQSVLGRNSRYETAGQSGVWRYMSMLVKDILVEDMLVEEFLFQPPQGIIWATALDYSGQLRDAMGSHQKEREEGNIQYFPGVLIGGSEDKDSKITMMKWRQAPQGWTVSDWKEMKEDILTQCLWTSVGQIAQRPGKGIATQSLIGVDQQSETLFATLNQLMESVFNWVAVESNVKVVWKSDRSFRTQVETAERLMAALKIAQDAGAGETFTPEEIRNIWEQGAGLDIPGSGAESDQTFLSRIEQFKFPLSLLPRLPVVGVDDASGTVVVLDSGDLAVIDVNDSDSMFIWVRTLAEDTTLLLSRKTTRRLPEKLTV